MANLKAIRKRITSVKNTQQITKAMKMVAAAKLRRAQDSLNQGRPYAQRLKETIAHLTDAVDADSHPLLQASEGKRTLLLVLTSDRGLCGAFNSSINRATERLIKEANAKGETLDVAFIGRKANEYFRHRVNKYDFKIYNHFKEVYENMSAESASDVSQAMIHAFLEEGYDHVQIIYNEFKSAMTQNVIVDTLLPIAPEATEVADKREYEFEPSATELFDYLLPLYVSNQIFSAMRESLASEMGARMTAMESASNNARDLISALTLEFNRARQAAITTEIIEIISGAEAL